MPGTKLTIDVFPTIDFDTHALDLLHTPLDSDEIPGLITPDCDGVPALVSSSEPSESE